MISKPRAYTINIINNYFTKKYLINSMHNKLVSHLPINICVANLFCYLFFF